MHPGSVLRLALAFLFIAKCPAAGGSPAAANKPAPTPVHTYKVVQTFDHDLDSYTQGLVYLDGFIYEGTGQRGSSVLRKYPLGTTRAVKQVALSSDYFGEGIAILKDRIFQLTWQSEKGFIYQLGDFRKVGEFSYKGEGWGLTTDGKDLIMSDGTAILRVLDGDLLLKEGRCVQKETIKVHDRGAPVAMLNELEMIKGEIFANVWQTDRIAVISRKTGQVLRWIDLSNLRSPMQRGMLDAVLNGIAYDRKKDRIFVTGKLWPLIYQIVEVPGK